MQGFQYQFGDRPLDGYTVQRALGRGGFGEVYYALSDSGRQVALKVIQGYEQIELRGVSQCMNLKSPHLVTIFDVRHNDQGKPFVIMEYVSGPPLRDLLDQCPSGLGTQKAAFFLREIGKGLTYLHDCGIVHRDLKPGNIFYEDGYVKIGDYGLSKVMSASRHSGQTITVGTVHYMAPEIGAGNYDRGIDIYALGVLLYEMLTGQVPYLGASPGEILMKHMMSEPDVRGIEEPFASVIRRAMVKDPAQRYQTVQEMVEDVFGAEHIQQSVSHFSPNSLSMVAGRVAREIGGSNGQPGSGGQVAVASGPTPPPPPQFAATPAPGPIPVGRPVPPAPPVQAVVVNPASDSNNGTAPAAPAPARQANPANDPLDFRRRGVLALATAVIIAFGASMLSGYAVRIPLTALVTLLAIVGAAGGITWFQQHLLPRLQVHLGPLHRFGPGLLACSGALLLTAPLLLLLPLVDVDPKAASMPGPLRHGTMLAVAIPLLLMNWIAITAPGRRERLSLSHVLFPAVIGLAGALMFGGDIILTLGILAGVVLAVQVASAYDPTVARFGTSGQRAAPTPANPHSRPRGSAPAREPQPGSPWTMMSPAGPRLVPAPIRALSLFAFVLLLGLGLIALIYLGIENLNSKDEVIYTVAGVNALLLSLFCLVKTLRRTFNSWWVDLLKPLLMLLCMMTCISAIIVMDSSYRMDRDQKLVALFLTIFPGLLFLVMLFVPNRAVESLFRDPPHSQLSGSTPLGKPISHRSRMVALLLSAGGFLGICGLHRFYAGKTSTGILWLITGGLCGIGQIIDIIMIATGQFYDEDGRLLTAWEGIPAGQMSPAMYARQAAPVNAGAYSPAVPAGYEPAEANTPPLLDPPPAGLAAEQVVPVVSPATPPFRLGKTILTFLGTLLILVAILAGLMMAVNVPAAIAAGLPDPTLGYQLGQEFGYPGWPSLLRRIFAIITYTTMTLGTLFLMLARRPAGPRHMIRAVLGAVGLIAAMHRLERALYSMPWPDIAQLANNRQGGQAVDLFLQSLRGGADIIAPLLVATVSVLALAWPARRRVDKAPAEIGGGV